MKSWLFKFYGFVASFAFVIAHFSAQSACSFLNHQPEMPESVKRLKKS